MLKNPNRKVIGMGREGLCITLPAEWAAEQGIKKGDLVRLTEEPAGLLISKVI
jgi:phosphate uptake regulator